MALSPTAHRGTGTVTPCKNQELEILTITDRSEELQVVIF